jgi:hypothetical protein
MPWIGFGLFDAARDLADFNVAARVEQLFEPSFCQPFCRATSQPPISAYPSSLGPAHDKINVCASHREQTNLWR